MMGDVQLFQFEGGSAKVIAGSLYRLERELQGRIESNLETMLGVKFLATEYDTGKKHKGRIDTLGIDENHCPVIIEYKRNSDQNVISQGLYYLDWLRDHRGDFESVVKKVLGEKEADAVEWGNERLLCLAGDFTKFDEHAVEQIDRNIELLRYRVFGPDLMLLEAVNAVSLSARSDRVSAKIDSPTPESRTVSKALDSASGPIKDLFRDVEEFVLGLGEDVQKKELKHYFAYSRIRNFACVEVSEKKGVLMYLKLNPSTVALVEGFTRDMSNTGHYGTGDLEVRVRTDADFERAKSLIRLAYGSEE